MLQAIPQAPWKFLPGLIISCVFLLAADAAFGAKISVTVTKRNAAGDPTEADLKVTNGVAGTMASISAYVEQTATGAEARAGAASVALDSSGAGSTTIYVNIASGFKFKFFKALAVCPGLAVVEYFDKDGKLIGREEYPVETNANEQGAFKFTFKSESHRSKLRLDTSQSNNVTRIQLGRDQTVIGALINAQEPGSVRLILPRLDSKAPDFELDLQVQPSKRDGQSEQKE